jgi:putative mRNA 3-end processing factor
MNSIHRTLGIPLKEGLTFSQASERGMIQRGVPWIMISPFMSRSAEFIKRIKSCCDAVTVGFTGWAIKARFRHVLGLDYTIPISDHCDFNELIEIVRHCEPEQVYTIHGFADFLATRLRTMGYEAVALTGQNAQKGKKSHRISEKPITRNQSLIDSYFH